MKRIHRKIITLQARVARRAAQDLAGCIDSDYPQYQEIRGKNYDLRKATGRAKGAKDTTLAKIIRAIVHDDKDYRLLTCTRGGPGGHMYNRIHGFDWNSKRIFVRILVGPFNESLIETDENGVMYIRDESSFSTLSELIS